MSTDVSGRTSSALADTLISLFPDNVSYLPFIQQMAKAGYTLDSMTCENRPYRADQLKELLLETNCEFSIGTSYDGGLGVSSLETKFLFTYQGPDKNPGPGFIGLLRQLFKVDVVRKKGDRYALSGYFSLLQVNTASEEDVANYHFKIGIANRPHGTFFDLSESDGVLHNLEKQKPPLSPE